MTDKTFKRARERLRRALNEAKFLYESTDEAKKFVLAANQESYGEQAKDMSWFFSQAEENPCVSCGRCCTTGAMGGGYHSHAERMSLISAGVNLEDYLVEYWEGEPEHRCLFLTPEGCNIPPEYRSAQCLTYVCYDRLGPHLAQQGMAEETLSLVERLKEKRGQIQHLQLMPYGNHQLNFGEG